MKLSAPDMVGPVFTPQYVIPVAVGAGISVLLLALWLKFRTILVSGLYADKAGLVLETSSGKADLASNQITSVRKLGRNLLFKTSKGWFLMFCADNLECLDKLLVLLKTWNFDLIKPFANLRSDAEYKKSQKRVRIIMAGITAIAIACGVTIWQQASQKTDKWRALKLYKAGQFVMAERDIPADKPIDTLDVREVKTDPLKVDENAILYSDLVAGKRLMRDVARGMPLTTDDFLPKIGQDILAAELICQPTTSTAPGAASTGIVVYTIKDVPEGQTIPKDALEERKMDEQKIPTDAIRSSRQAIGKKAKYGMSSEQIVSEFDLRELPAVCASKNIVKGQPIDRASVKIEMRGDIYCTSQLDEVIGKIPSMDFKAGAMIPINGLAANGKVFEARHEIKAESSISAADLKESKMEPSLCPASSVESLACLSGAVAAHNIAAGQLIRSADLLPNKTP
jgi:flagella basal body P-ring formation protein FlgA